jgi:hypothetical protein
MGRRPKWRSVLFKANETYENKENKNNESEE